MATRYITTKLTVDGEREYKKQLGAVNQELRNLKSEMNLTTEEFKGQANSMEALSSKSNLLNREIDQQKEKVRALEQAVKDSSDAYGDSDRRTDGYRQSLNRAKTDLIKMQRELEDTDRYMDEARRSTDKTATSIDGFGRTAKDAAGSLDQLGGSGEMGVSGLIQKVGGLKAALAGGAIAAGVAGLKEMGDAIMDIEESTRQHRQIMGSLQVTAEAAGYSAEQTAEAYERLYGVLGDDQTTATTLANLQAIGLSQGELLNLIYESVGAWSKYGDSIPIDGLAESINETIRAGEVTGTFADVLNWGSQEGETFGVMLKDNTKANEEFNKAVEDAKTAEDFFNIALSECGTQAERADLIMQTLSEQGLADVATAYYDVNEEVVAANKSQQEWEEAMAGLGDALAPVATKIREFGTDAILWLTDQIKDAIHWLDIYLGKQGQGAPDAAPVIVDGQANGGGGKKVYEEAVRQAEEEAARTIGGVPSAMPGLTQNDMTAAMANAITMAGVSGGGTPGSFSAAITLQADDGQRLGRYMVPFVRSEDKSNPEVVSDR